MATSREVKCINTNKDGKITHIGGDWGQNNARVKITEAEAIRHIDENIYSYHVKVNPKDVKVIVVGSNPRYLKTAPDDTKDNNLLSLPECL